MTNQHIQKTSNPDIDSVFSPPQTPQPQKSTQWELKNTFHDFFTSRFRKLGKDLNSLIWWSKINQKSLDNTNKSSVKKMPWIQWKQITSQLEEREKEKIVKREHK